MILEKIPPFFLPEILIKILITLWCAAIDPGMNEHKYIVPGIGDCGDLCYGEKL